MTDEDAPVTHLSGGNYVEPAYLPRGPWTYESVDPAIMLFTAAVQRFGMRFPSCANILEVGCAETDWLERMAQWDNTFQLIGVDQNRQIRNEAGFTLLRSDGLDPGLFPAESFDWIVMLGALEHFGLGFYGDSLDDDGDVTMMRNIQKWLRPHGLAYFDVPAQPEFAITENRHFRMYSPAALTTRIVASGLHELQRAYSLPEPHAGTWCGVPQVHRHPYYYCAVLCERGTLT